jgi:hypothetical protein
MNWILLPLADWPQARNAWQAIVENRSELNDLAFLHADFIEVCLAHYAKPDCLIALGQAPGTPTPQIACVLEPLNALQWQFFIPSQLPLPAVVGSEPHIPLHAWTRLLKTLPGWGMHLSGSQLDAGLIAREGHTLDSYLTAWVDIAEPFADYWAKRSKNFRSNHRKMLNRLQAEGYQGELRVVTKGQELDAALAAYGTLEASGWKNQNGTAVGGDNNTQLRFYQQALTALAASGKCKVFQYWIRKVGDGGNGGENSDTSEAELIASDLCVESGSVQVVLKTAYAEAFAHLSPSTLLRYLAFEQIFQQGQIKRIEFYGKKLDWHTRWTETERMLYHRNIFRNTLIEKVWSILKK